jgi:hypothetical protein
VIQCVWGNGGGLEKHAGLKEVEAAFISKQWAHEGGKVSPTNRPLLLIFGAIAQLVGRSE